MVILDKDSLELDKDSLELDKDSLELDKDSLELRKLSIEKEIKQLEDKKFDIEIALVKKQLELSRLLEKLNKVKHLGD